MNKDIVRQIAISNGFELSTQNTGQDDIQQKVYSFTGEIISHCLNHHATRIKSLISESEQKHSESDCEELKLYLKGIIQAYQEELKNILEELTNIRDLN